MNGPSPTQGGRAHATRAAVVSALLLLTATANGADPVSAPTADAPSAERLAEQAYELHAQGKYPEAIATYLKAYELSKAGATLFNVATIYDRKLHERELASDYYRRYLAAPDAEPDLVQKATERLTALKRDVETTPSAVVTALPPASAPASSTEPGQASPRGPLEGVSAATLQSTWSAPSGAAPGSRAVWRTTGTIIGSTGLASLGASLALGLVARNKNDDANAVCSASACTGESGVRLAQQAGTFATASTIAFIAGVACAGAGLAMYFAAPASSTPARLAVSSELDMRGAEMSVRLGF